MQYHLDTIPVWDALKADCACPLCKLEKKCEADQIDYTLGGSVMEPDVRIRVNDIGFCQKHHQMLYDKNNRLGHALLCDSHSLEVLEKIRRAAKPLSTEKKPARLFAKSSGLALAADQLEAIISECVVCQTIQQHMNRYLYTFVHLWSHDKEFRTLWEEKGSLCLPHTVQLLRCAQDHLSEGKKEEFGENLLSTLEKGLSTDEKDLEWFTKKFDYRNQNKPWGNSKDAIERTVNRLRGHCLGADPAAEPPTGPNR